MILIPAGVLLVSMMLFSGGPERFFRTLNLEISHLFGFVKNWVDTWIL